MRSETVFTTRNTKAPLAEKSSLLLLLALLLCCSLAGAEVSASVSESASFEVTDADLPSDTRDDIEYFLPQRPFCLLEGRFGLSVETGFENSSPAPLQAYQPRAPPCV